MHKEIWKDIPEYPGYQASSLGRIRSLDRRVPCKSKTRVHKGRVLKQASHPNGYLLCAPCINGKVRAAYVHHLVMRAFVGPLPEGCWTAHNDGNPANNALTNLRYDTVVNNHRDKHRHNTLLKGAQIPQAKVTEKDVLEIRQLRASGLTISALILKFKVSRSTISRICRGETWAHVGGPLTRDYFRSHISALIANVDPNTVNVFPFKKAIGDSYARPSV